MFVNTLYIVWVNIVSSCPKLDMKLDMNETVWEMGMSSVEIEHSYKWYENQKCNTLVLAQKSELDQ